MRRLPPLMLFALLLLPTACTFRAVPAEVTLSDIPTLDPRPVPGRWAIYTDAVGFNRVARIDAVETFGCGVIRIPVAAREPFETSAYAALDQVFETLEPVPAPLTPHQVHAGGYTGYVEVRARTFTPTLLPYYRWQARYIRADAEMTAGVRVFDGHGALRLGEAFGGTASVTDDAWRECRDGDEAIAAATSEAMRDFLTWMTSRLAQEGKIRQMVGQQGTSLAVDFE